jgi:hypothetical protein
MIITSRQSERQNGRSQSQIDNFTKCIVKAIVTRNVKFAFIENVHLLEALNALGIPSISPTSTYRSSLKKHGRQRRVAEVTASGRIF